MPFKFDTTAFDMADQDELVGLARCAQSPLGTHLVPIGDGRLLKGTTSIWSAQCIFCTLRVFGDPKITNPTMLNDKYVDEQLKMMWVAVPIIFVIEEDPF